MMDMKIGVVVFLISFNYFECARILAIFPNPSISHQLVFRSLVHGLARRGHEVFVLTPEPTFPKSLPSLNEIDVRDVGAVFKQDMASKSKETKTGPFEGVRQIVISTARIMDLIFEKSEVSDLLKSNKKFDLILLEFYARSAFGLSHVLNAPIILVSSFGILPSQNGILGGPMHPLIYPFMFQQRLYNLTFTEKIASLMVHKDFETMYDSVEDFEHNIARKHFGQGLPSFKDLYKNIQMIFVNYHPLWTDCQPVSSNIQYVGGIHSDIIVDEPLPQDLKTYLDLSQNGVIYVSFGTNVNPSQVNRVHLIMSVLSKMPYDVIFKWNSEDFPKGFDNIKFSKWLPQAKLLKHPKIKVFVTQGGLQSADEAINAGVPLIAFPIYTDQFYNAEKYEHHKIGLNLDLFSLTEKEFKNAVETVIGDMSYKHNIIKLRGYMRESTLAPIDLAVYWAEHIIQNGGTHLQPLSAHISWIEYYEVSLILTLLMIKAIIISVFLIIINKCA